MSLSKYHDLLMQATCSSLSELIFIIQDDILCIIFKLTNWTSFDIDSLRIPDNYRDMTKTLNWKPLKGMTNNRRVNKLCIMESLLNRLFTLPVHDYKQRKHYVCIGDLYQIIGIVGGDCLVNSSEFDCF